ncbi:hypothetical protein RA2_01242 [Roseovarius sp. A-2]|uniref:Panacea domain-containing protein n=1 Tax=Roseovarius sp. A-2 TaxID=1570360 RepID=UPI0009CB3785|nr:type II toxin-antitoxin system antitoxin SocA domain-containing protein [Roseovarius sp. A-2]GAW34197.1 hypothetical protein RA2_01242 [Roseovarius sp. A-2]
MSIRFDTAAQYICEKSGWSLTQLSLQKILYIAHMVHMGRERGPLVDGHFEAWDYGPVHPKLYQKVKAFGAKPIPNVFWSKEEIDEDTKAILDEACENLLDKSPADLVRNTHWEGGAWAKHYLPKARNVQIPSSAIMDEYRNRMGRSEAA